MKLLCLTLLSVVLVAFTARAEDTPKLELAVKLVEAMDYCDMLERNFKEMKSAQTKQMVQMGSRISEETSRDLERTYELIREILDCDSMIKETAAIYAELFSADEIKSLTHFYLSDIGQRYNKMLPEIMKQSMQISMTRINDAMPGIIQKIQLEKAAMQKSPLSE